MREYNNSLEKRRNIMDCTDKNEKYWDMIYEMYDIANQLLDMDMKNKMIQIVENYVTTNVIQFAGAYYPSEDEEFEYVDGDNLNDFLSGEITVNHCHGCEEVYKCDRFGEKQIFKILESSGVDIHALIVKEYCKRHPKSEYEDVYQKYSDSYVFEYVIGVVVDSIEEHFNCDNLEVLLCKNPIYRQMLRKKKIKEGRI